MQESKQLQYQLLNQETLYSGFFQLTRYQFQIDLFQGGRSEAFSREIFERGHAAAVILLDRLDNQVVLVEQFRPGAVMTESNPWLIEPVAGMIEPGEKPEAVVRREAVEESGCEIKRLHKICEYLVSPGGATERIWLYLGEIDSRSLPDVAGLDEEHEDIRIHKIPIEKAFQMLDEGKLNNGMTLIGMQWLKLNWQQIDAIFPD